jgi:hypothetical protein
MRRAVLMLATFGLALAGCSSHHCDGGTLTVYWDGQNGSGFVSTGGVLQGCDAAGVATLDISINGAVVASQAPCHGPNADGITLTNFGNETVAVQLDAYDSQGNLLYQDVSNVDTAYCRDTVFDAPLSAVAAPMNLEYLLPVSQCPPGAYVWLSLVDTTDQKQLDLVDQGNTPTAIACGNPDPIVYSNALYANYRLDWIQVVQWDGGSGYTSLYEYCTPTYFTHSAPNDTLSVTLQTATTGCP